MCSKYYTIILFNCLATQVGSDTSRDAYSIIRMYLNCRLLPHANEVNIGEMIHHFKYYYKDSTVVYPWMTGMVGRSFEDFRLVAAVVKFGLILRNGGGDYGEVLSLVKGLEGDEVKKFVEMVNNADAIKNK